jgi:ribosomal protein S13
MKPIRKNELEYIDQLVDTKFNDKEREISTAIEAEVQIQADKNLKSFINKLNIAKEMKAYKLYSDKLQKFQDSKDIVERDLRMAKNKAEQSLNDKLNSFSKIRDWKGNYNSPKEFRIDNIEEVESDLKSVCKQETERQVRKLPKFKVAQQIDELREECKTLLHMGMSIDDTWKNLAQVFNKGSIKINIPKQVLQLESK